MRRARKTIEVFMLLLAAAFLGLHAVHLTADFPNNSPWMDWAKYTDEGWYGNAAIEHYLRGSWYVPGDFNPAVALPVWPAMEAVLFHFTGVSLVAVRALTVVVFGLILVATYFLLRRYSGGSPAVLQAGSLPVEAGSAARQTGSVSSWAPAVAVLLLAASPFCYAFTRLAILEPLLVLMTLLALLAASAAGGRRLWPLLLLGVLLPLMVLTKTTAIFLLPAVFYLLLGAMEFKWRPFLRAAGVTVAIAAALWGGYYLLLVRPHYLADYQYLFSANGYTRIARATFWSVVHETLTDGMWMDSILYPAAWLVLAAASLLIRSLWRNPLFGALVLWIAGYLAFLAYHDNMQPRYYLVVAVPMTLLLALAVEHLWRARAEFWSWRGLPWRASWLLPSALSAALVVAFVVDAREMLHFVRTPEYTFERAAWQVKHVVDSDPNRSHLVMSISGNNLSLMTGLPSICDDFGTMELEDRIAAYHPGWYVAWNEVEDDKQQALSKFYRLERVAAFPAMDDPERNLMIVYRLQPLKPVKPRPVSRRRRPVLLEARLNGKPLSGSPINH